MANIENSLHALIEAVREIQLNVQALCEHVGIPYQLIPQEEQDEWLPRPIEEQFNVR
jgi:hypothetical protein